MKYEIEVETWDEDIYTLDEEYETLEEALKEANLIAYRYKAVGVNQLNEEGIEEVSYDIYGDILGYRRNKNE